MPQVYYYAWRNNPKRVELYRRHCRVLARGKKNSVLVEFDNGQREIVSRNALRRVVDTAKAGMFDNALKIV